MTKKPTVPTRPPNQIRAWRKHRGLTQEQLAEATDLSTAAISQIETGKQGFTDSTLYTIADRLTVPAGRLLSDPPEDSAVRRVRVTGHVQAGAWAETWELPYSEQYDVPVPYDESVARFRLHGAETRGPSMNRRYPERTVLVFADIVETGESLTPGSRYIVERERADGMREGTVKTLWRDEAGKYWLIPESTDPRFQEPIPIEGGEDETVRIVGRVRYAVSKE